MISAEIPHSLVLSVSTCAPQWLVWSFCYCAVPVCNHTEENHTSQFFSLFHTVFAGTRLC